MNAAAYLGQSNWQMPPTDGNCAAGYACSVVTAPFQSLFYTQLGLTPGKPVVTAPNIAVGAFTNIQPYLYWTCQGSTIHDPCAGAPATGFQWSFWFDNGFEGTGRICARHVRHGVLCRLTLRATLRNVLVPVVIRAFSETDVDALVEAVRESYAEVSPWMVWCQPDYAHEHAATWIRSAIAGPSTGSSYEFAVLDTSGTLAGVCGVNHVNNVDRFANIGFWIRTSLSRRGIAPAAVLAVAEWTFANTHLNRLEIVAAVGNTKSQRVAQKVGAVREAVLRQRMMVGGAPSDAVVYSLVRPTAQ